MRDPLQKWVIVDTETDGLDAPIHVVEIAAQLMEGWDPCGPPFQVYVNHDTPISPQAVAIHGYTREFLRNHGRPPLEAHEAFRHYAKDRPLVAHNIAYDWNRALEPEWLRLGLAPIGQRGFCTMLLARRVIDEATSFRLDALKSQFQLGCRQSHKALEDVRTVVQLFREVIRPRLEIAGLTSFYEWAEFSRQLPIAKCLLRVKPERGSVLARTYYLRRGRVESLEQLLDQLARMADLGSAISVDALQNLKAQAAANPQEPHAKWARRWLERLVFDNRVDEVELAGFEAALVKRLKTPRRLQEAWGVALPADRKLIFDTPKSISISGHCFCFTGKAAFGPRTACEAAVLERGGICVRRPEPYFGSRGTDYLVVGSIGAPSSKCDEAALLRKRGDPIMLITEHDWLMAVQQTPKTPGYLPPPNVPTANRRGVSRTKADTQCGGISVSFGIGPDGPFSKIERLSKTTKEEQP